MECVVQARAPWNWLASYQGQTGASRCGHRTEVGPLFFSGTSCWPITCCIPRRCRQSDGIDDVIEILSRMQIPFVRQVLNEGGIVVKQVTLGVLPSCITMVLLQVFFHDPDHNTIEICNCDCLPMVEISDENLPSADAPNHRQEKR